MAISACFTPLNSLVATHKPRDFLSQCSNGVSIINHKVHTTIRSRFHSLKTKAGNSDQSTKPNSVICSDCDGNGAVLCSQCKGSGVNSVDFFDGQFKTGDSCWLCGDMLCGNCNGAGFKGGFMTGFDN